MAKTKTATPTAETTIHNEFIEVFGAREHNLKTLTFEI